MDRADRCKQLFSKFNSTGTASLSYIGKNTYHNPCKIECPLCESETPTENIIRKYPAHIHYKDEIATCNGNEAFELYEQFMEDGIKCGPHHVSIHMDPYSVKAFYLLINRFVTTFAAFLIRSCFQQYESV